jgi:hypothetical protein
MPRFFKEVTDWKANWPNHTYFLSDDKSKMFAYVKQGEQEVFKFKKPIGFDTRGRKFVAVENTWNFELTETEKSPRWEIQGSRGDVYVIEQRESGLVCSCSGFRFRGNCKHVQTISQQSSVTN